MAKAPAFQFYAGDFLTGTTLMSNAEVGLFIRLLCIQAEHGSIPDDVERIVRAYGEEARQLWAGVQPKFNRGSTKGTLVNERLSIVLAARDAFREKQSIKGKASAASRSSSETKTKHKRFNRGSTVVEPLGDRDIVLVQEGKERAEKKTPFDAFWTMYAKGSRKLSAQAWDTLPEADRVACLSATPAYLKSKPDPVYRKDGERYLRHRTWEDPITVAVPQANGKPVPMTRSEALAKLEEYRAANGIAPGGVVETHLIPADIYAALK